MSAMLLTAGTMAGQVVALVHADLRPVVLRVSLLVLHAFGIFFSVLAARRSNFAMTWHLVMAARALALVSLLGFAVHAVAGGEGWWIVGSTSGIVMFIILTSAVMTLSIQPVRGAERWSFVAEVATVFFSGSMLAWYFVLAPSIGLPGSRLVLNLGWILSELMMLVAVTVVLLRGAVTRTTEPLSVLLAGIMLYAISSSAFSAAQIHGVQAQNSAAAGAALVLAALLMTVSAMLASSPTTPPAARRERGNRVPIWSSCLPYVAVGIGNTLMLVLTIRQPAFALWGGLTIGQIAMTTALAARQIISLRESRRLNVTDPLTGLANLSGLQVAVENALNSRGRPAVMLLDLDGFKQVNDRYGHDVGDRLLTHFAHLLRGATRRTDVAARVGGDEFIVVLEDIAQDSEAVAVAERILATLVANPVKTGDDELTIRASIGLAIARPDETAEDLRRRADLAMYESKRSGTNGWRLHNSSMIDRRIRHAVLADELRSSAGTDQFSIVYQPVVDLSTHQPVGVEALLRWDHPYLGSLSPAEFIPIAERIGIIHQLGMAVLRETCDQAMRWRSQVPSFGDLKVAVNISAIQLQETRFLEDVIDVLTRTSLPADAVVLEITESAIVDEKTAVPILEALRNHGIGIAIDDFGTGYSSLHQLTQLPVDLLKIDRSFVAKLDSSTRGAAVAEAVIRLAQVLGLHTLAEGVETAAQAAELQMLGCPLAQGYLFAKPLTAKELTAYLIDHDAASSAQIKVSDI